MIRQALMALALFAPVAAQADVTYTFMPSSYSGSGSAPVPLTMSFELTDAAVQAGSFSIQQNSQQLSWEWFGDPGLVSLSATAPLLKDAFGINGGDFWLKFTFGPNGQIESSNVDLSSTDSSQEIMGNGTGASASLTFSSDNAGFCRGIYKCTVSGQWIETQTPVPEPMSAMLFCTAMLGLAVARKRFA